MRGQSIESRVPFVGLTRHNNVEMSDKAASIAGIDADDPPETSLSTAIRDLYTADQSSIGWRVPENVEDHFDVAEFNQETPDSVEAVETVDGRVYVDTDRFQSVFSPEKLRGYVQDSEYEKDDGEFSDALWQVPSKSYSIVNPVEAWGPLEDAIQDEDLGDEVFGEIRSYKSGGEIHMDVLFDNYQIEYTDEEDGSRSPIVLGVRTGYDFFGGTALYFEGFGQDTHCDNSIRAITEESVFRHVGDVDLGDEITDILEQLGVMQSRLSELIEMAEEIELDLLEMDFAEPFDHTDNLRAFYELSGLPTYLAQSAAAHARSRASNSFQPDMTNVWDGATFALTHEYVGGENTSSAREYVEIANDYIYNPSLAVGRVNQEHERRLAASTDSSDDGLENESARATIEDFDQTTKEKADEFETRTEELRNTLVEQAQAAEV